MIRVEHIKALMAAGGTIEQVVALMAADDALRAERRRIRAERQASQERVTGIGDVTVTPVTSQASRRVTLVTLRRADTPGAVRTRRWRERKQIRALHGIAAQVRSGQNDTVTSVTSQIPVTPGPAAAEGTPLKGVLPPAARQQRGAAVDRRQGELRVFGQIKGGKAEAKARVEQIDPAFAELGRMRGKPYPVDRAGGWSFEPDLVETARRNLAAAATGPPVQATG